MRYIKNNSTDPFFNIALEEYCLKNILMEEDYFILWQNEPSVIIGKNQNTIQEVNMGFIEEESIKVVRRISGGGAVYHDFGNLNFTFISCIENLEKIDFKKYVDPIIKALAIFGVNAELTGRNDITVGGKKISGNAQRLYQNRLMHHGTLLFDVNLDNLVRALNVSIDKIQSKGIQSVISRVANIRDYMNQNINIDEFKNCIENVLSQNYKFEEFKMFNEDLIKIQALVDTKFSTWGWNFGESPAFNIRNKKKFPGGEVEVLIDVTDGIIRNCRFYGDYLGILNIDYIENELNGLKYDRETIRQVLRRIDLYKYFGSIQLEELITVLCG